MRRPASGGAAGSTRGTAASRFPALAMEPKRRRRSPCGILWKCFFFPRSQLYSSATGRGKEFLAGAPRRPSPWRSEVPGLRHSERRGERQRGAAAGRRTEAAWSRAFITRPPPSWPPLSGNADASHTPSICGSLGRDPFKAERYNAPRAFSPLRAYKKRLVAALVLSPVPHA